jgi:hypothetical protein
MPQIPKTRGHRKDTVRFLTCPNVTGGYWVDRLIPIPKPCVAGSSPAGGAHKAQVKNVSSVLRPSRKGPLGNISGVLGDSALPVLSLL